MKPPSANAAPPVIISSPTSGTVRFARRVGIYGDPGAGKSTLASLVGDDPLVLDLNHETAHLPIRSRLQPKTWAELRAYIQRPIEQSCIVIDSASKAEELCVAWALENIPMQGGKSASNIEAYGYGKGFRHVYDTWHLLLADLDRLTEQGKVVVMVMHSIIETTPNPQGEDFIRFAPRLQASRQASIQSKTIEWLSDLFFIGFDVASVDGKGRGGGTRTIYGEQRPTWIAKSRPSRKPLPWNDPTDRTLWSAIL